MRYMTATSRVVPVKTAWLATASDSVTENIWALEKLVPTQRQRDRLARLKSTPARSSPERSLPVRSTGCCGVDLTGKEDRKSTRLNSSHLVISYAVFCLKKKNASTTDSGHDGRR